MWIKLYDSNNNIITILEKKRKNKHFILLRSDKFKFLDLFI